MKVTARAPGKLIISGEHAVVHGHPALAMAVNRYADTTVRSQGPSDILFNLVNLPHKRMRTREALRRIKGRVENSYTKFLSGEKGIRDVLKKPFELIEYTASHVLDTLSPEHNKGFEVHTESNIPTGCGMGSSAATVISTNFAIAHYLNKPISQEMLLQLGLSAENLQHGKSSGLDLYVCVHGGCHYFQKGQAIARPLPKFKGFMINTGTPDSTTGECVKAASHYFHESTIGNDFAAITDHIDQALQINNIEALKAGIAENHRLLCKIGVVPQKIQEFIKAIEQKGASAKICGAGAIYGDKAGMVLIIGDTDIDSICKDFGYIPETVQAEPMGVRLCT